MEPPQESSTVHAMRAANFVWGVLFAIAVPTAGFAFLGQWLDKRFDASPWFLVASVPLSILVVTMLVRKKAEEAKAFMKTTPKASVEKKSSTSAQGSED